MIRPQNLCLYLRQRPYCTAKQSTTIQKKKRSSFDIDSVVANHEKRTEYAAAVRRDEFDKESYRMILPPPNVTGNLHLGHALTVTIEDAMCRYRRFLGQKVSWYPGFDHAGIATQVVVERMLWNEKKLRRHQVTQREFLQLCQQWKQERAADMSAQLKALGATLDWHNAYYTLDNRFCEAVTTAFCQLHKNGLIFNDMRMVNWCPTLRSTISDQEVDIVDVGKDEYFSINTPNSTKKSIEVGVMHRIRYELLDGDSCSSSSYLEVGTTRPETVFADCALAVNPDDVRYSKYVGRRVLHPLVPGRTLPVLADDAVQCNKGTGVLKVTPAHDFLDFVIARKHADHLSDEDLNRSCIDESGCLINAPNFEGMDRFEARNKVIEELRKCGRFGGSIPYHEQQLRICNRTGDIIEPVVKKQWFLDCSNMNDMVLRALEQGSLVVTPKYMQVHLENWLSRKEPWCLSRQLDWGNRIPAFRPDSKSDWIVAPSKAEALRISGESGLNLKQDEDVLDTWFCSALIPIVLSGWPGKRIDRIPFSVLETGYDIVGFWVARMITVCQSLTGYLPFLKVVLHGLVRDESGRKMSKSLGNVIDPMDVIGGISVQKMLERLGKSTLSEAEKKTAANSLKSRFPEGIRRCGPDALRFALLRHDVTAMDINIDVVQTAEEGLRFCNKLWNLCTYAEEVWQNCDGKIPDNSYNGRIEDCWIRSRLESTFATVAEKMDAKCPHLAFNALHKFLWNDLCDVYVETTKKALWTRDQARLMIVADAMHEIIEKALIHLSIFMPFVSEYLFDRVKRQKGKNLYDAPVNPGAEPSLIDKKLEEDMSFVLEVVKAIRSMRAQFQLSSKNILQVACHSEACDLRKFQSMIQELCNATLSTTVPDSSSICSLPFPVHGYSSEIYVTIEGDYSSLIRKELMKRLQKAQKRKEQFLHRISKHEKLARNATREDLVESNERRMSQAQAVVNGMIEEITKLETIIERLPTS